TLLDLHERADQGLVADRAAVQVHEREDLDVPAELDVRGDAAGERVAVFGGGAPSHQAPRAAGLITTVSPPCSIDFCAASRIRTTRHPARPSATSGSLPAIARTRFSASTASASRVSSCGACMSPERYEISNSYSFSGAGACATVNPLS